MTETERRALRELRTALLQLHKTLLDWERVSYERVNGRMSPGELLKALTSDPYFAWLRPVSEMIVRMDGMLDADPDDASGVDAQTVIAQTQALLVADEDGTPYARRYYTALQEHPDAIIAHRQVTTVLKKHPARETLH
jgi:hypothetical protein